MMTIYAFLEQHGIVYRRFDHPAVFTCQDVLRLIPDLPGRKTKNLFLCDARGREHFLLALPDDKSADLKTLALHAGVGKLRLASADRLRTRLGLEPGSVTLLALVNDPRHCVQVLVDQALWAAEAVQCHPLVNTSTLVLAQAELRKFLDATGHCPRVLDVPSRTCNPHIDEGAHKKV